MQIPLFSVPQLLLLGSSVFSILFSLLIIKKDYKSWLNRLLFLVFFSWALAAFFYALVFVSFLDLALLNLIRDLNLICGITAGFALFLAGYTLAYSEEVALQKRNILLIGGAAVADIFIALIYDSITIENSISYTNTEPLGSIALFLIPGLLAMLGIVFFIQIYRSLELGSLMKTRVLFFIIGASLLVLGALINGIMVIAFPGQLISELLITIILLWAMGPVSLVWGLYGVKE